MRITCSRKWCCVASGDVVQMDRCGRAATRVNSGGTEGGVRVPRIARDGSSSDSDIIIEVLDAVAAGHTQPAGPMKRTDPHSD